MLIPLAHPDISVWLQASLKQKMLPKTNMSLTFPLRSDHSRSYSSHCSHDSSLEPGESAVLAWGGSQGLGVLSEALQRSQQWLQLQNWRRFRWGEHSYWDVLHFTLCSFLRRGNGEGGADCFSWYPLTRCMRKVQRRDLDWTHGSISLLREWSGQTL